MSSPEDIKVLFSKLPASVQSGLLNDLLAEHELKGQVLVEAQDAVLEKRKKKPCPHCGSEHVYKRGKQNGVQMYQCRSESCKKWYSETTGTPLAYIKLKPKWQAYLRCMEQGKSIKATAKEVGICIQTSFDWRHKILSALNEYVPEKMTDVIECDELELAVNNKGDRNLEREPRKRGSDFKRNEKQESGKPTVVQVVTAVQRNGGGQYFKAVESKRLSKQEIEKALEERLSEGATLITDKHPSYKAFAKGHPEIKHKTVLSKQHVSKTDKTLHLQKVNNTHSQLRKFLTPFNGVSSKYLQNYLNWFAYADKVNQSKTTLKQWLITIIMSDTAYELFSLFKQNAVIIRT